MTPATAATAEDHVERQAVRRRLSAFEGLGEAIADSTALEIPPPVTVVRTYKRGVAPKLPAEAFELARQVYYLQHGSVADAARAVIAAGLTDNEDLTVVRERLRTWWDRMEWPKRPTMSTFAIRDANYDGGLFRSTRVCSGEATGSGPAPKGKACTQSALPDSDKCFHHDPRPEYVDARRRQAERLAQARQHDAVPVEPFQRWLKDTAAGMLADARAEGRAHPNEKGGMKRLADAMGVDNTLLWRIMRNIHNGGAHRRGAQATTIRACTVVRYLEPLEVTFRDVYGFDPPAPKDLAPYTCPECGRPKTHESKLCRECYEQSQGERCSYVDRSGRLCPVITDHESGVCGRHRRITERVPRPRAGRRSWVTTPMLILALDEYRRLPIVRYAARRMWAVNAAGVRDVFASQKVLTGSLVKQFRKRGWHTADAARAAYDELVAEHGKVEWPTAVGDAVPVEAAGMVPLAPFREWLAARHAELGSYNQLARRLRFGADTISRRWLRNTDPTAVVRRATVDEALERWGDGATFADVYGSPA
jgi:hypothetical protein